MNERVPFVDLRHAAGVGMPNPTDLAAVNRLLAEQDGTGSLHPIEMRSVRISADALESLPDVVRSLAPSGPIVVLADVTPIRREQADLKALVVELLRAVGDVRLEILGVDRPELHADEMALAEADAAVAGAGCVVAVGSGTVTDIAKDATYRAGGPPLVVVQTAVSVNAFSDNLAVLLRHGVKRTIKSRWPDALIVDLPTIATAPPAMNQAGFGELLSMFTAPADWYLAHALGMDARWHPAPVALFRAEGESLLAAAALVRERDPGALALLARLMTLSGMALGAVGASAPLSGTEHLVSHLLDMAAERAGRPLNLHGAQVGVAAVVAAIAWQETLDYFDPDAIDVDAAFPPHDVTRARVREAFLPLDPSGAMADECWRDVESKLERWSAARPRFEQFLRDWSQHRTTLGALVVEPSRLAEGLRQSGGASTFAELERRVPSDLARWAIRSAPLMRDRFVLADLRLMTGSWTDADVSRLVDRAGTIGLRV